MSESPGQTHSRCSVAVAIFTRNDTRRLSRILDQLNRQDRTPDHVLIVDNSSNGQTLALARASETAYLRIPDGQFDVGLARDAAVMAVTDDVIVFLSGDATPSNEQWLGRLIEPFELYPGHAVTQGRERPQSKSFYWERPGSNVSSFTAEHRRWKARFGMGISFVTCAIRRQLLVDHPVGRCYTGEDKMWQARVWPLAALETHESLVDHDHRYEYRSISHRIDLTALAYRTAGEYYRLGDLVVDLGVATALFVWFLPRLFIYRLRVRDNALFLSELLYLHTRPIRTYLQFRRPIVKNAMTLHSIGRQEEMC